MAKVAEYLQANISVFKTLVKIGKVPPTVVNQFDIYNKFVSLENVHPSKMDRYSVVAVTLRVSEKTVERAVKEMEKTFDIEVIL